MGKYNTHVTARIVDWKVIGMVIYWTLKKQLDSKEFGFHKHTYDF
jgi:hypothetical protein